MAEAILSRKGGSRFRAFSAGSKPKGEVHPYTLDLLENRGFDPAKFRSKSWEEFANPNAPVMEFVITVCDSAAGEVCPVWPGQPMTAHWGFPDPAAFEGTETETRAFFAQVYGQIERRIEIFLNLPLEALDRMSLQREVRAIGETSLDESE
jgi:protein-tyrosine-phosphatase